MSLLFANNIINENQVKNTHYFTEQSFNIHFNKPNQYSHDRLEVRRIYQGREKGKGVAIFFR